MQIRYLTHRPDDGWSAPLPAELDSARTLVVVFAATRYAERAGFWAAIADAFPHSHVLACSSAGEIAGSSIDDASAVLAVSRFERATLTSAAVPIQAVGTSRHTGEKLGRLLAPAAPAAVLVLSDGLQVNGADLVRGLVAALPAATPIVGGLAADATRFARTWTLVDGVPRSGWVTAVALSGPVNVGIATRSGWQPFGPERCITRSEGSVLHELDGRPALALYKDYLGELASGLPSTALLFPLAVTSSSGGGDDCVRTAIAVDESSQSMTFAGDMPQGARARLMRVGHERLIDAAAQAGAEAVGVAGAPVLALAISCLGRRLVLGERCEEETEATLQALPAGSTQVGFYSYGGIAPSAGPACGLQNQTMTLATFREIAA